MSIDRSFVAGLAACALSGCSTLDTNNTMTSSLKPTTSAAEVPTSANQAQRDACEKWRIAWRANPDDHQGMTQEQWQRKGQVCADLANSKP